MNIFIVVIETKNKQKKTKRVVLITMNYFAFLYNLYIVRKELIKLTSGGITFNLKYWKNLFFK